MRTGRRGGFPLGAQAPARRHRPQPTPLHQYAVVTATRWAFTVAEDAGRMPVGFNVHQLGTSSLGMAFPVLCSGFRGIHANRLCGWIGARFALQLAPWAGQMLETTATESVV